MTNVVVRDNRDSPKHELVWKVCRECYRVQHCVVLRGHYVCRTCLEAIDREFCEKRVDRLFAEWKQTGIFAEVAEAKESCDVEETGHFLGVCPLDAWPEGAKHGDIVRKDRIYYKYVSTKNMGLGGWEPYPKFASGIKNWVEEET